MAGAKFTLYLLVPIPAPAELRAVGQANAGDMVVELCDRCWSPYLAGKLSEHMEAIPHRRPPLGAQSPEG